MKQLARHAVRVDTWLCESLSHVHKHEYKHFNVDWVWPQKVEFPNFSDGIVEQIGTVLSVPSAKQQLSNIKHGGGIRPNVWVLTFGPPCIFVEQSVNKAEVI